MKYLRNLVLASLILGISQTLISQDTIQVGDTVLLSLDTEIYGSVQWQVSADGLSWEAIPLANNPAHKVVMKDEVVLFRAKVSVDSCNYHFSEIIEVEPGESSLSYAMTSAEGVIDADLDLGDLELSSYFEVAEMDPLDGSYKLDVHELDGFQTYVYLGNQDGEVLLIGKTESGGSNQIDEESTAEALLEQFASFALIDQEEQNSFVEYARNGPAWSGLLNAISFTVESGTPLFGENNLEMDAALQALAGELQIFSGSQKKSTNEGLSAIHISVSGTSLQLKNLLPNVFLAADIMPESSPSGNLFIGLPKAQTSSIKLLDDVYEIRVTNGLRSNRTDADELALYANTIGVSSEVLGMALGRASGAAIGKLKGAVNKKLAIQGSRISTCNADFVNALGDQTAKTIVGTTEGKSSEEIANSVADASYGAIMDLGNSACVKESGMKSVLKHAGSLLSAFDKLSSVFDLAYNTTSWAAFLLNYRTDYGKIQLHKGKQYPPFSLLGNDVGGQVNLKPGEDHDFSARISAGTAGNLQGIEVDWEVSGPESTSGTVPTDASGNSDFNFMAPENAGNYTVTANVTDSEGEHVKGSPVSFSVQVAGDPVILQGVHYERVCSGCACSGRDMYRTATNMVHVVFEGNVVQDGRFRIKTSWGDGDTGWQTAGDFTINGSTASFQIGYCWGSEDTRLVDYIVYIAPDGTTSNQISATVR